MVKQDELLKLLVDNKTLSLETAIEIRKAVQEGKGVLDDILLAKKIIDSESLVKLKSGLYNLPSINLLEREIASGTLNIITSEVSENYKIICFEKNGDKIKVGIIDPENFKAVEAVDYLAKGQGLEVEYYLISPESFRAAFKGYKSASEELTSALKKKADEDSEVIDTNEKEQADIEEVTKSAPVAKIVSVIIRNAVEGGASDIHIEPMINDSRVRYRIDGILHTSLVLPRSVHNSIVARIKVMANLKIDETRIPQDGRIRLTISEKAIDFRVSVLPLIGSEKIVMRILDTTKGAPALPDLGFQGEQLGIIEKNLEKTEGLFLVTGPTGSGKSTTLFAVLDILNKEGVNISTLEDPVEYQMKGINQSQVKPEIGYTFSSGLRSFLRQDPDVIMVGEIRDEETAELAIHAALTGHVVVSTLHTNSAAGAIPRLIDMKLEPFLLGSTLHTVVAQRLARRICPHCREAMDMPEDILLDIKEEIAKIGDGILKKMIKNFDPNKLLFLHGKGCARCGNSGYSGRICITEVLDINDKLKKIIFDGVKDLDFETIRKTQNFTSIKQDGIIKVLQGYTTMEEVMRVTKD